VTPSAGRPLPNHRAVSGKPCDRYGCCDQVRCQSRRLFLQVDKITLQAARCCGGRRWPPSQDPRFGAHGAPGQGAARRDVSDRSPWHSISARPTKGDHQCHSPATRATRAVESDLARTSS
jgi:hypothetical protein